MKHEWLVVPEGMCPLEVLANKGTEMKQAWIELDDAVLDELETYASMFIQKDNYVLLTCESEDVPETGMMLAKHSSLYEVVYIDSPDIDFTEPVNNPDRILTITMEE